LQNTPIKKLLFIYNAKAGFVNMILDGAHKLMSPSTYPCSLCAITYGNFSEKSVWKRFRKEFRIPIEFVYKDEFEQQYASKFGHKYSFPIVLAESNQNQNFEIFIKTDELNTLKSQKELIDLVSQRCA